MSTDEDERFLVCLRIPVSTITESIHPQTLEKNHAFTDIIKEKEIEIYLKTQTKSKH